MLERTARRLLEKETLDEAELLQLVSTGGPQPADRTLVQLEQGRRTFRLPLRKAGAGRDSSDHTPGDCGWT